MAEVKCYPAVTESLDDVLGDLEARLADRRVSEAVVWQLVVAVEELFVNICHYAYPEGPGEAALEYVFSDSDVEITFVDSGIPYDPLSRPDPDVNLPLEERQEGGLGIYIVKKTMDSVRYEYRDGHNRLSLRKTLQFPPPEEA